MTAGEISIREIPSHQWSPHIVVILTVFPRRSLGKRCLSRFRGSPRDLFDREPPESPFGFDPVASKAVAPFTASPRSKRSVDSSPAFIVSTTIKSRAGDGGNPGAGRRRQGTWGGIGEVCRGGLGESASMESLHGM